MSSRPGNLLHAAAAPVRWGAMRKIDPADVRAAFRSEMGELLEAYRRTSAALRGPHAQADVSRLSSGTFLVCYVVFERFVSDLVVAYLNRDFSKYRKNLKERVLQSVGDKFKVAVRGRTQVRIPKHPSVAEIQSLVDADGRNVTFPNTASLKQRTGEWLVAAHASRIQSLGVAEALLIDAALAVRDFVGHRSLASKRRMNEQLKKLAKGPQRFRHLGRGVNEVHSVGSFLRATPPYQAETRLEGYVEAIRDIAQTM